MPAKWRGYLVVVGGVLIHLTLGTVYTFGKLHLSIMIIIYMSIINALASNTHIEDMSQKISTCFL